jgi:hypothetical protein
MIRIDKGTKTLATLDAFLRRHHEDMDAMNTVIYGPSTDNQVCLLGYSNFKLENTCMQKPSPC